MILVTGATGLVGSYICRKFLQEGVPIKALKRAESSLTLLEDISDQITWSEADLSDIDGIRKSLEGVTHVIHCAAKVLFHSGAEEALHQGNVEATKTLVNLCLEKQIHQFIHISSVAAIGRNKKINTMNEDSRWFESRLNTQYGKSKYLAEMEVWRGMAEGLPAVIFNPSVVITGKGGPVSSSGIFHYAARERLFYPSGNMNLVDARDVADAVWWAYQNKIEGQRYILNAGALPFKELFQKIAGCMGKKPPKVLIKPWMVWLAVWGSWISSVLTGKPQQVTKEIARVSGAEIFFSNDKFIAGSGSKFRPIEASLEWASEEYLATFEKNYKKN